MKHYMRFTIYVCMPTLVILPIPAIVNITTGGNWAALMAFYNIVLYIIPVSIMQFFLIRRLNEPKPQRVYLMLDSFLSTICLVLLLIAWASFTPIVALVSYVVSFLFVKLYKRIRTQREMANIDAGEDNAG